MGRGWGFCIHSGDIRGLVDIVLNFCTLTMAPVGNDCAFKSKMRLACGEHRNPIDNQNWCAHNVFMTQCQPAAGPSLPRACPDAACSPSYRRRGRRLSQYRRGTIVFLLRDYGKGVENPLPRSEPPAMRSHKMPQFASIFGENHGIQAASGDDPDVYRPAVLIPSPPLTGVPFHHISVLFKHRLRPLPLSKRPGHSHPSATE